MFLILVFVLLLIHYYNDEAYDHTLSFTNVMDRFVSLLVIFLAIDVTVVSIMSVFILPHNHDAKLHHQQQITALKYEIKLSIGSSSSMLPSSTITTTNASPLMTTDELLSKMKQYTAETTNFQYGDDDQESLLPQQHQQQHDNNDRKVMTATTNTITPQDIMNVLYEYCQNDSTLSCYSSIKSKS